MNKISNLVSKHIRNVHFVSTAVLVILLFVGDSFVNPFINQVVSVVFYAPFSKLKNSYLELNSVADNNEKLSQTLIEASLKIAIYEESQKENDRLRSILGFEPPPEYSLLPAEVISISGTYIPISAIINLGTDDSILVDQPVINQQGLIGRISLVSDNYSVVQLLTDPSNRVAARVSESREMGIIKYNTGDGMLLDNFPIQGTINIGDHVVSSGLGGVYPAGLVVGTVIEIIKEELQPFYLVKVAPVANFYSLEELFVLREDRKE